MLTEIEVQEKFGLNPFEIGFLPSDYWIVTEPDTEDKVVGAENGDLCISSLDGDEMDISAGLYINFIGTVQDPEDEVYRYYYFKQTDCFSKYTDNSVRCKKCNVAVECYDSTN